jgi:hypothetical protein
MSSNVTPGFKVTVLNNIFAPNGSVMGPNMRSSRQAAGRHPLWLAAVLL